MDAVLLWLKAGKLLIYKKELRKLSKLVLTRINPSYKSKTKKPPIISDKVIKARLI